MFLLSPSVEERRVAITLARASMPTYLLLRQPLGQRMPSNRIYGPFEPAVGNGAPVWQVHFARKFRGFASIDVSPLDRRQHARTQPCFPSLSRRPPRSSMSRRSRVNFILPRPQMSRPGKGAALHERPGLRDRAADPRTRIRRRAWRGDRSLSSRLQRNGRKPGRHMGGCLMSAVVGLSMIGL